MFGGRGRARLVRTDRQTNRDYVFFFRCQGYVMCWIEVSQSMHLLKYFDSGESQKLVERGEHIETVTYWSRS